MPLCKRPRKLPDIVSVLDEIQQYVHIDDYNHIIILLSIYDQAENHIARANKKITTKSTLYTKTCQHIFESLPAPHFDIIKILTILQRIEDVTLAAKTLPKDQQLSDLIHSVKLKKNDECVQTRTHILKQTSQLQISMRIRSMSKILFINQCPIADKMDSCRVLEDVIPVDVLQSKQYGILKNYCLLGAIIQYTDKKKQEYSKIFSTIQTITYAKNVKTERDLEKVESEIYQMIEVERKAKIVKIQTSKQRKQSVKNIDNMISVLRAEYDSAKQKLEHIRQVVEKKKNTETFN